MNEQPIEQHDPPKNIEPTLRRSTRERKSAISGDYVVYLQELVFNVRVINDLETFSQNMNSKESKLWFDAMKDEMDSMASNGAWDLVNLPNRARAIGCKWVFKTKTDSLATLSVIRQDS